MRPAEVLAVEVEQFLGADGLKLLTPRAGRSHRARGQRKGRSTGEVADLRGPVVRRACVSEGRRHRRDRATAHRLVPVGRVRRRNHQVSGCRCHAHLVQPDGKPTWPFFIRRSTAKAETALRYLQDNPAFASDAARLDLLERIKGLPGQTITTTKATGWPAVPLQDLANDDVWQGFTALARDVKARTAGA